MNPDEYEVAKAVTCVLVEAINACVTDFNLVTERVVKWNPYTLGLAVVNQLWLVDRLTCSSSGFDLRFKWVIGDWELIQFVMENTAVFSRSVSYKEVIEFTSGVRNALRTLGVL